MARYRGRTLFTPSVAMAVYPPVLTVKWELGRERKEPTRMLWRAYVDVIDR